MLRERFYAQVYLFHANDSRYQLPVTTLDDAVDDFIKVLFNNYDFNTTERNLWSLPVRMGGIGLMIPSKIADAQYSNSRKINELLTAKVRNQQTIFEDIEPGERKAKAEVKKLKETRNNELLAEITAEMGSSEKAIALEAIQEKGASSWLNTLPIKSQGYAMDKQSFRDAISTRYGILLSNCLLYTSPSPRDYAASRMPSSA